MHLPAGVAYRMLGAPGCRQLVVKVHKPVRTTLDPNDPLTETEFRARAEGEPSDPPAVAILPRDVAPLHPAWIPAFAGMTISGVCASLGWRFDTPCFAGMTFWFFAEETN